MNIGEVSEALDMPAKTIRYYEDIGLVTPARRDNGYRSYSAQDLHRLGFLGRARSLGFSIAECRALVARYSDRGRASADVRRIAEGHLGEIERKIDELAAMRDTLRTLVECCHGDARPECPILADLAGKGEG